MITLSKVDEINKDCRIITPPTTIWLIVIVGEFDTINIDIEVFGDFRVLASARIRVVIAIRIFFFFG
jgi:hypothetical protein